MTTRTEAGQLFDLLSELWHNPWWGYDPRTAGFWSNAYRWFNLFEGVVWLGCALFVLVRWRRSGRGWLDLPYAMLFVLFGLTDFREAGVQSAPLVLVKGIILVALFLVRRRILPRYPAGS